MKQIAWLTDIHLNFLTKWQLDEFFDKLQASDVDIFLISGDIGEATDITAFLRRFDTLGKPVYFVLGNHDFYHGSVEEVRQAVAELADESQFLTYLTASDFPIALSSTVGLIGHDSWSDGRCGDYQKSSVILNDHVLIREFIRDGASKADRLRVLNKLGDEAAQFFEDMLPKALAQFQQVYLVTHVPPFREATWHMGDISDDNFLPHFSCKVVGEVLVDIMQQHPDRQLTVLCGHTHSDGRAQILDNLLVLTGWADYGVPDIQDVFELD